MTVTPDAAPAFAHPRGSWLDPSNGRQIAQDAVLRKAAGCKAVLLGESHTDYEIHRWQLHVAVALQTLRPNIALGFEMFPRAKQDILDDWVAERSV